MSLASIWSRPGQRFVIIFGVLAVLLFVAEQANGRGWMNDFRVYWGAANALFHGEEVYGISHGLGSGVFKYAPVIALLFVPLALLPYSLAAALHFAAIAAAFLWATLAIDRLIREQLLGKRGINFWVLFLSGLVAVVHLHRELHLGNINMLLLALLLLATERMIKGHSLQAGLLFGLAMLAKPHFVVLLPLFLLRKRWVELGLATLTLGMGVLLPAIMLGLRDNWALHKAWAAEMAKHNASLIYSGGSEMNSVNTLYSFLHRSIFQHFGASGSSTEAYLMLGVVALLFGAFVWSNIRKDARTGAVPQQSFVLELLLLIALVPSITLTDTEHFLFAMPLVVWVFHHLLPHSIPRGLPLLAIPTLLAYGGNWEDALRPLSDQYIHYGILGIGNIVLLLLSAWLFARRIEPKA